MLSHAWVCALRLMCCFVDVHELLIMMSMMNCVGICGIYLRYISVVILLFNNVILTPSACVYVHL